MEEQATLEAVEENTPQCRHHWIIETPRGAISQGHCKVCGASKEFFNSAPGAMWENDTSLSDHGRWNRTKPSAAPSDDGDTSGGSYGDGAAMLA